MAMVIEMEYFDSVHFDFKIESLLMATVTFTNITHLFLLFN